MDHFADIEGRIAGLEAEVGAGFAIDRYGRTSDDPLYDDVDERFRRFERGLERQRMATEHDENDDALGRLRRRMEDDT
jgi:hypothetical protein